MTAGIADHAVQHAEVEIALRGFDLGPGNARQDGVESGFDDFGP